MTTRDALAPLWAALCTAVSAGKFVDSGDGIWFGGAIFFLLGFLMTLVYLVVEEIK